MRLAEAGTIEAVAQPGGGGAARRQVEVAVRTAESAADWRAARALMLELFDWIERSSGHSMQNVQDNAMREIIDLSAVYAWPRGRFFVASAGGVPVGTGGVLLLDEPGVAELKRMYIRPEGRGLGLTPR